MPSFGPSFSGISSFSVPHFQSTQIHKTLQTEPCESRAVISVDDGNESMRADLNLRQARLAVIEMRLNEGKKSLYTIDSNTLAMVGRSDI